MTRAQQEAEKKVQQQEKPTEPSARTSEPQFQYVTPIEDLELVKNIAKQGLDVPITVST